MSWAQDPRDVDRRRVVEVDRERRLVPGVGNHSVQIEVQLPDSAGVGAGHIWHDLAVDDHRAVAVCGAGGSIGSAVAKEFAAEGAEVFLAGRTKSSVEAVATEIVAKGGRAHVATIDTTHDAAVNRYIDGIVKQTGKIDIVLDAAGPLAKEYGNGKLAVDLPIDQFMVPVQTMVKSRFITARAAARHMVKQRSGVIIFVTGSPARPHVPGVTGIGAAFGAIENLTANLALS